MELPSPQNPAVAAYAAIAILSELLDLLVTKGLVNDADVSRVVELSATRLHKTPNFDGKSAAEFLRSVVKD